MKKAILIMILGICLSSPVSGEPLLSAICGEPSGPRIDISPEMSGNSGASIEHSKDKYSGVHPLFTVDADEPNTLKYVWGNTEIAGDSLADVPTSERSAKIQIFNENIVSAVEVYKSNRVSVFTLLPKIGIGVFTDHTRTTVLGENVKAVTFTSDCRFLK